jgi:mono/diheme cytochrome c family protein
MTFEFPKLARLSTKPARISVKSGFLAIAVTAAAAIVLLPTGQSLAQGPGNGPNWSGPNPSGPMWGGRDLWMPGWMHRRMWRRGPGDHPWRGNMSARLQRHWSYMHEGVPSEYAGARSTVKASVETLGEGGQLYMKNCASCHGKTGMGDGDAGKALSPSPALLAFMIQRPVAVDEFLLWSISEGGQQFKSDMPAFKGVLKRDDIWKIIAWMRAGFPEVKEDKKSTDKK